ncbi:MAG: hypothetical protein Q9M41_01405, partial [Paracoccaceae bacterium]|nr:hypothetical protein [Paracoccaceae bacterium]
AEIFAITYTATYTAPWAHDPQRPTIFSGFRRFQIAREPPKFRRTLTTSAILLLLFGFTDYQQAYWHNQA